MAAGLPNALARDARLAIPAGAAGSVSATLPTTAVWGANALAVAIARRAAGAAAARATTSIRAALLIAAAWRATALIGSTRRFDLGDAEAIPLIGAAEVILGAD